jgi:cytochrome P450
MTAFQAVAKIPGPALHPVLGWRGLVLDFARDPVSFLTNLHDQHGKIARVGQGKMSATFTFHPDYTRQILSNPNLFYSFSLEDIPFPFSDIEVLKSMTTALSLLNGEQHKRQRRLMAPAFHNHFLPVYVNQIRNIVEKYFSKWKRDPVVDIYQEMDLFTILLSMEIFVGMEADEEGTRFAHLFESVLILLFSPPTFLLPYDFPGSPYHSLRVQGTKLEQQLKDLIRRRRKKGLDGTDTLSMFLKAHDEDGSMMSENEIVGETVAVFRGGSKTSASALTWTLFLLTQHPNIYSHLTDELTGTLKGAAPTLEQLNQLPLLEGVIKESMRLIPPVLWGVRYGVDDFEIDGYHHEKGSSVLYSSYVTHHMPELYNDPQKFNPSRWETIKPSAYEYFPFNAGPRRCLGAEFAMMEIKITLAILLQKYHFTLIPNQRIDRVGMTGSLPKYGIKMRIAPFDGKFCRVPVRGNVHKLVALTRTGERF